MATPSVFKYKSWLTFFFKTSIARLIKKNYFVVICFIKVESLSMTSFHICLHIFFE